MIVIAGSRSSTIGLIQQHSIKLYANDDFLIKGGRNRTHKVTLNIDQKI
jgi:hypothetical protein